MKKQSRIQINLAPRELLLLLVIIALIFATFSWSVSQGGFQPTPTPIPASRTPTVTPTVTASPTVTSTGTATLTQTATVASIIPIPAGNGPLGKGLMVMSIHEGGYAHLFAFQPETLPLTRLSNHPWDDISPAISPDGNRVAFSSRQNGYWDLFLLDLRDGSRIRLTDTPGYEGSPTWSPDGEWLAYEGYQDGAFDIFILSLNDRSQAPIQLTSKAGRNYSPSWSPQGRLIAFVSTRTEKPEIWMADLDKIDDRFINISNQTQSEQSRPVWSPYGMHLAWVSSTGTSSNIFIWDQEKPDSLPRLITRGDWPVWSPDGTLIATRLPGPTQSYLTAYQVEDGMIVLPPVLLPGQLEGFDWRNARIAQSLPGALDQAARVTPTPMWTPNITPPLTAMPAGRSGVVKLKDVTAPNSMLLEGVADSFTMLRARTANELGWDFLSSLENAFIPISDPLPPGLKDDWLYTGRSIAVNPVAINAGWMVIIREIYDDQIYWRIFLRTRYQDGSQGRPLYEIPWDLNARYGGDPQVYEDGGVPAKVVPAGYWVDFTDLAAAYGWERLSSLLNWRTYYPGIRFNQYVLKNGLDWQSAMLEIYPQEILITPTPILPPTSTPTLTVTWIRPRTATSTRTATTTSTPRPTWTPIPP
jgi:TolB protein